MHCTALHCTVSFSIYRSLFLLLSASTATPPDNSCAIPCFPHLAFILCALQSPDGYFMCTNYTWHSNEYGSDMIIISRYRSAWPRDAYTDRWMDG
jgi:hypothetical protein